MHPACLDTSTLPCPCRCTSAAKFRKAEGELHLTSPRAVRLLIEAGADTTAPPLRVSGEEGVVEFNGPPLALVNQDIHEKKVSGLDATEEQLHGLEAVRRLYLRVEAVHAVSWLWRNHANPVVGGSVKSASRTDTASTTLGGILPILRRQAGRHEVLLAPMFRSVVVLLC